MPDIALYYPYTHIRDQVWLKAAALYLPRLALIAPPDYPRRLSRIAEVLRDELGFLVDVDPRPREEAVASEFLDLVGRDAEALRQRYAWPADLPAGLEASLEADGLGCCKPGHPGHDDRIEWIHLGKVPGELLDLLIETRLGVLSSNGVWVGMHPRLGAIYLAALAERIAEANSMPVVTDQTPAYGALNGWSIDTLASVLGLPPLKWTRIGINHTASVSLADFCWCRCS